ncbi:MAG TPA: hypothetical protein VJ979_12785 [Actinomycetota bacterium]|nr:hypothetical protein [Actinomycetota bacterium]
MSTRAPRKAKGFRRFERWLVGLAFAVMAFVLEKVVMRSIRKADPAEEPEDVTTMISKGGEVDVDL